MLPESEFHRRLALYSTVAVARQPTGGIPTTPGGPTTIKAVAQGVGAPIEDEWPTPAPDALEAEIQALRDEVASWKKTVSRLASTILSVKRRLDGVESRVCIHGTSIVRMMTCNPDKFLAALGDDYATDPAFKLEIPDEDFDNPFAGADMSGLPPLT